MNQLAKEIAAAIKAGRSLPKMPVNLGIREAYELQKAVVDEVAGGELAGLKAGLTAPSMREQFGVSESLIACLYESGRMMPGVRFASSPGVMIECELGILVDGDGHPTACGPVVEVPRMNFADGQELTGATLIACSIAADRFIVGTQLPMRGDYGDIDVRLERDGEVLSCAPATDALGGPQKALSWMLDEARKWGLPMKDGMLCITGACGGAHRAVPGQYLVDYGELGSIEFTVT